MCLKSILSILGKTKPRIYLIGNSKEQNQPGDIEEVNITVVMVTTELVYS